MSALAYVLPRMLMHASLTASPRSLPVSGAVLQDGGAFAVGVADLGAPAAPRSLPVTGAELQGGRQIPDMCGVGGEGAVSPLLKVLCFSGMCSLWALSAGAGRGTVLHSLSAVCSGFSAHVGSHCTRCMYCRIVPCFRPGAVCLVVLLLRFMVVLFTGGACRPCAGPVWRPVSLYRVFLVAAGAGSCACAATAVGAAAGSLAQGHLVAAVAVGGPAWPCGGMRWWCRVGCRVVPVPARWGGPAAAGDWSPHLVLRSVWVVGSTQPGVGTLVETTGTKWLKPWMCSSPA
jgi:hypothetical protein